MTLLPSAAWWTLIAPAPSAKRASNSSAQIRLLLTTSPTSTSEASPTAATPTASWSTRGLSFAFPRTSTSPERLPCFAPESRLTPRCATGASARTRRLGWSVSADSVIWAPRLPMRSERTLWCSRLLQIRRMTLSASARTRWSFQRVRTRCRSTLAASTSSSTPSLPTTT